MTGRDLVKLEVPRSLDGERLDRGISMLTGMSRSQAARLVDAGMAYVAGRAVLAGSRRLRAGELLEVPLDEPETDAAAAGDDALSSGTGPVCTPTSFPSVTIVYVDDDLIVLDKPAGLVVHPGAGNRSGTLVDRLLESFPDIAGAGPDAERPGIVHRLDKGTSGLLVVARSPRARLDLVSQMSSRSVHRRYIAVAHGEVADEEGVIEAPVGRSPNQRVKMAVVQGGRFARTRYRVLRRASAPLPVSLIACRLETGRTHQVRVHLAAIGHPVVADERYCAPALLREGRRVLPNLHRPFLHAAELGFRHPVTGSEMSFRSELPDDLGDLLAPLGLA